MDAIDLPVIQIGHRGKFVSVTPTKDELTTCASGALKTDYFSPPHVIVDAGLRRFDVTGVRRLASAGPFWGFSFKYGRRFRIAYEVASISQISLDELKRLVAEAVRGNLNRWSSGGVSIAEIVGRIAKANSFSEIVDAIETEEA